MGWKKVGDGVRFLNLEVGQMVEGSFLGSQDSAVGSSWLLDTDAGTVALNSRAMLDRLLEMVETGSRIRIRRMADGLSASGKTYHRFEVERWVEDEEDVPF